MNIYPDTKNLFEYAFNNFQKIQVADEKKPDEVEKFISAADSQSAVSAQSDGSEDTESVQTGGNEYQPLEDGYVILPKDVSYKDIDYEITDVDEDTGEGTIRYIYDGHQVGSATAEFTDKYLQKVPEKNVWTVSRRMWIIPVIRRKTVENQVQRVSGRIFCKK